MPTAPFLDRHPGPYTIEPYARGQLAIRDARGRVIAVLPAVRSDSTRSRAFRIAASERAADALALAALPELIAALRAMVAAFPFTDFATMEQRAAHVAAIAALSKLGG